MTAYVARRIAQAILILFGISLVTFVLLYLIPADPARQIAGRSATAETVDNIRTQLGLNLPFYEQYWRYITALLRGDLGRSYLQKTQVAELIASRLPASLLLMAGAIVTELVIGLSMGLIAALRRGTWVDSTLMVASFVGVSAPQFVIGILLLYVFAVQLGWFPIGGYGTFAHLVLPSLTLGILGSGCYARMMRSSMLDVLNEPFITTARAQGLPEKTVIGRYAMRTAAMPVVTVAGLSAGYMLGGAVAIEIIFALPGLGRMLVEAVGRRDYPLVEGGVLTISLVLAVLNLVIDLIYAILDPRIRYQ